MKAGKRARYILAALAVAVVLMALVCLFVGSSRMSLSDGVAALFGRGSAANVRILRSIRVPRVLAALIAGAALSVSGLVMQTTLSNAMASPSTMGVSNAAVFGANLSIIVFAGGYLSTGNNLASYTAGVNPFAASVHRRRLHLDGGDDAAAVLCHRRRAFRRGRVEFRRSGPRHL